jgi:aspartyl-tRNA(Asn)/glutamyl-tRNA(Gln) amidotransferase subunit A
MFSQNGPITRTVRDAATILQVMAGYDSRDPTTLRESSPDFVSALDRDISGLRVAWSPDFGFANVWPEVRDVTLGAARQFEDLGCHIDEANLTMEEPYDVFGPIQAAHAYSSMGHYLNTHQDQLTDFAKFYLEFGSRVTASDYAESLGRIEILKALITDLFDEYDLLLSPTSCFPAFPNEEFPGRIKGSSTFPEQYWNGAFTLPVNVIGHPAATVPAGFSSDGLPIGLHIVGKWGDEATVLAASAAFERVSPWIHNTPFI